MGLLQSYRPTSCTLLNPCLPRKLLPRCLNRNMNKPSNTSEQLSSLPKSSATHTMFLVKTLHTTDNKQTSSAKLRPSANQLMESVTQKLPGAVVPWRCNLCISRLLWASLPMLTLSKVDYGTDLYKITLKMHQDYHR